MASSQPIALPNNHARDQDHHMSGGTPMNGSAGSVSGSLTRYTNFLGSPVSWRAGSFGSRFYPATSPGHGIDPTDFKLSKPSSSLGSDHGSIINAFNMQDEMCRNFTCCGLHLTDLHALLEHFEEVHVVVVDPYTQQPQQAALSPTHAQVQYAQQPHAFDPDDMELDPVDTLDAADSLPSSAAPSPPHTPLSPFAQSPGAQYDGYDSPAVPQFEGLAPASAFDTTAVPPARVPAFPPPRPFAHVQAQAAAQTQSAPGSPFGVPPALLHSAGPTRVPSPASAPASPTAVSPPPSAGASKDKEPGPSALKAPSLLLSKPFRCPKPNCSKSYKQANGLKYHMTHGACSFTPGKDVREVQALLASRPAPASETEMRELEREAERRLRPFACGVGDCQRRYKNMNGLRYHYGHSGGHGAEGLRMLAEGTHECLKNGRGARREGSPRDSGASTSTSTSSGVGVGGGGGQGVYEGSWAAQLQVPRPAPVLTTTAPPMQGHGGHTPSPVALHPSPLSASPFSSAQPSPVQPTFAFDAQAQAPVQVQHAGSVQVQHAGFDAQSFGQQGSGAQGFDQGFEQQGFAHAPVPVQQQSTYSSLDPMRVAYAQEREGRAAAGFR